MPPEKPSPDLGPAGRHLLDSVTADFHLQEHERRLLVEAAHVADLCELLQATVATDGPTAPDGKLNPAVPELRQQRILLARLLVALRLPLGDTDEQPQRRGGVRGAYGVQKVAS